MARATASDVLFEQTGKRVRLGLPQIAYDGTKVDVTLNGLGVEDLGNLSLDQLIAETAVRTSRFALEAVTLPLVVATTDQKLNFEADVLDGIKDGFRASGGASPAASEVTVKTSMEVHAGASAPSGLALNPFGHK